MTHKQSFVNKLKIKCGATESEPSTDRGEAPTYSFARRGRFAMCAVLERVHVESRSLNALLVVARRIPTRSQGGWGRCSMCAVLV